MVRKTVERLLSRRAGSGEAHSREARASAAAEDYLTACAQVGVTPNGGPYTADDLAQQAAKLRAEG